MATVDALKITGRRLTFFVHAENVEHVTSGDTGRIGGIEVIIGRFLVTRVIFDALAVNQLVALTGAVVGAERAVFGYIFDCSALDIYNYTVF